MWGTLSILDQLATIRNQTVAEYGEQRLSDDFQRFFDAQNTLVTMMLADLVEQTDERLTSYGQAQTVEMYEADEYTRVDAQKALPTPTDIGFPLRKFQVSLQWTRSFLQVSTPADLANQVKAVGEADLRNLRKSIARALFTPTNNLSYVDRWVDGVTLPLRALYNADGAPIPQDAFGNTFNGSSHTHYLATSSGTLTAADIEAAVNTVSEHGVTGRLSIYVNRGQEAAMSAMANFTPYLPIRIEPGGGSTADEAQGPRLAPYDPYNRAIGLWDGATEVWVKPWIYPNYLGVFDVDPAAKILRMRVRPATQNGALHTVVEDEKYPLRARTAEREFGISVWQRGKGAILQTNSQTYSAPTIS